MKVQTLGEDQKILDLQPVVGHGTFAGRLSPDGAITVVSADTSITTVGGFNYIEDGSGGTFEGVGGGGGDGLDVVNS